MMSGLTRTPGFSLRHFPLNSEGMKTLPLFVAALALGLETAQAADATSGGAEARLAPEKLKALHEDRLRFAKERRPVPELSLYKDFRAVIHVHAEDSDHTKGTRDEV